MRKIDMSTARYIYEHDGNGHFFDRSTMKFFASRIESTLYKNRCFITSEKTGFHSNKRHFTVRRFNETFTKVATIGEFLGYHRIEDARRAARSII